MTKMLTSSEVKKHNHRKSVWIVLKNDVYDVTAFLNEHPGGEDPLLDAAGMDATRAFEDVGHSEDARSLLYRYKIGSLAKGESCSKYHRDCTECDAKSATSHRCLDDEKPWREFDKPKVRSTPKQSKTSLRKSRSNSPPIKKRRGKSTPPRKSSKSTMKRPGTSSPVVSKSSNVSTSSSPKVIPRVQSIVVPRRRGGVCRPPKPASPPSSSKWKWALLALAAAIIVGVAYKKYAS